MRFIDEASLKVIAGHGGPGCVSFRREKFIPRGGPDGGDGGDGGDVYFIASNQIGTLQDLRYRREYKAESGIHGSGSNKAGKDGSDITIRVPVGTVLRDADTSEVLCDFTEDGQLWLSCKGGRGGKGNAHFVSSTFQAPKFAQEGEAGEERELKLELKLLADAAIIGFPNAGKSTLISRISAARPKIADYAFTTLTPNLGVVSMPDYSSFVVADIPGLIEGAHRGMGLGHKFLKHIERTRVFVHLVDGAQFLEEATRPSMEEGENDSFTHAIETMVNRYEIIRKELGLFNEELTHKPEVLAINKADLLLSNPELLERTRSELRKRMHQLRGREPKAGEPFVISAVSGDGIPELLFTLKEMIFTIATPVIQRTGAATLPNDESLRA
jgi:GTPase